MNTQTVIVTLTFADPLSEEDNATIANNVHDAITNWQNSEKGIAPEHTHTTEIGVSSLMQTVYQLHNCDGDHAGLYIGPAGKSAYIEQLFEETLDMDVDDPQSRVDELLEEVGVWRVMAEEVNTTVI